MSKSNRNKSRDTLLYWVIEVDAGWLVRRFWRGEYDTVSVYNTEKEAMEKLAELNKFRTGG